MQRTTSKISPSLNHSFGIRPSRLVCGMVFLVLLGCSDPTGPAREPRNTFKDWQHIEGKVCGVWTKDHNPHVITGPVTVGDEDSLVVGDGVEIFLKGLGCVTLQSQNATGYIHFNGTQASPIRFTAGSSTGLPMDLQWGRFQFEHTIFEGNGKVIGILGGGGFNHCDFVEAQLHFMFVYSVSGLMQKELVQITSSIFTGFRTWDVTGGGTAIESTSRTYVDSSLTKFSNNIFYGPIGDSLDPASSSIVNVLVKTPSGFHTVSGLSWPGNGNMFANPKWASYTYVGPNPTGISSNDYHLQPGSPAIGAGADGGNIGAY